MIFLIKGNKSNMKKNELIVSLSICLIIIPFSSSCSFNNSSSASIFSSPSSLSSLESSSTSSAEEGKPSKITFFSINDTHGAIEESPGSSYMPGMSKLSYLMKNDADYNTSSVFLSSGDMFQGSALSNMSEGLCMTEIMNDMGFSAMAIGNHEFDWGVDKIRAEEAKANFPFLGINIYSKSTGKIADFAQPSVIIKRQGARIGIIGSILSSISSSISANQITDIDFKDDSPLVIAEAKRLKEEEKCDLVIVSTHQSGTSGSSRDFGASPYIDGIFGGHDHAFTETSFNNKTKYFLEAGSSGKAYAKMTFTISSGKYSLSNESLFRIYSNTAAGTTASIVSIIKTYLDVIGPVINTVVGYRDGPFSRYSTLGNLGNLVTTAMMYYAETVQNYDVDCAIHNKGGVRNDLDSDTTDETGKYPITIGNMYEIMPFDNMVQLVQVTGDVMIRVASSNYHSSQFTAVGNEYYINKIAVSPSKIYNVLSIDFMITNTNNYFDGATGININGYIAYTRDIISTFIGAQPNKTIMMNDFPAVE
jgi:2',3'-cyclic-nucleotide 2'-phosphodiesterase (5'-nucleotidase family)